MKKSVVLILSLLLTIGLAFKPNNELELGAESELPFEHGHIIISDS